MRSGALAGCAALVSLAWLGSGRPNIGQNLELTSLTAAMLGGVGIFGGKGDVVGVLAAVLLLVTLQTGLPQLNVNTIWQVGIVGMTLLPSYSSTMSPSSGEQHEQDRGEDRGRGRKPSEKIAQTVCELVSYPSIVKADPREAGPGERDCQASFLRAAWRRSASQPISGIPTGRRFTPNTKVVQGPTRDALSKAARISAAFSKGRAEADVRSCSQATSTLYRRAHPTTGSAILSRRS